MKIHPHKAFMPNIQSSGVQLAHITTDWRVAIATGETWPCDLRGCIRITNFYLLFILRRSALCTSWDRYLAASAGRARILRRAATLRSIRRAMTRDNSKSSSTRFSFKKKRDSTVERFASGSLHKSGELDWSGDLQLVRSLYNVVHGKLPIESIFQPVNPSLYACLGPRHKDCRHVAYRHACDCV